MDMDYALAKRNDEIDRIFNNIGKMSDKIDLMLSTIENNQKIDKDNLFIKVKYNVASNLKNKFVEISEYFERHDMDFYEDNFIKHIIENELMSNLRKAYNVLSEYYLDINIYYDNRIRHSNFFGIRSGKQKKLDKEEIERMNSIIDKYEDINNKIVNYKLDINLVNDIVSFIERNGYDWFKNNIGTIESIEYELDKLDLSDLVYELEKIIKEKNHSEILPNNGVIKYYDIKMSKDDIQVINVDKKDNKKSSHEEIEKLKKYLEELRTDNKEENNVKSQKIA